VPLVHYYNVGGASRTTTQVLTAWQHADTVGYIYP
jgi:hypothetical protein